MKTLIIGSDSISSALGERWKKRGWEVTGITNSPAELNKIQQVTTKAELVDAHERHKIMRHSAPADLVVFNSLPRFHRSIASIMEMKRNADAITESCRHITDVNPRCIFLSTFAVYGQQPWLRGSVDEYSHRYSSHDALSRSYQQAEDIILSADEGCVLRLPDIYGIPENISVKERVKLGMRNNTKEIPLDAKASFHHIHYLDVLRVIDHVITEGLSGSFNVCDDDVQHSTNQQVYNKVCDREGWPRLTFTDHIKMPHRPVSAAKIRHTGFQIGHTSMDF